MLIAGLSSPQTFLVGVSLPEPTQPSRHVNPEYSVTVQFCIWTPVAPTFSEPSSVMTILHSPSATPTKLKLSTSTPPSLLSKVSLGQVGTVPYCFEGPDVLIFPAFEAVGLVLHAFGGL